MVKKKKIKKKKNFKVFTYEAENGSRCHKKACITTRPNEMIFYDAKSRTRVLGKVLKK